MRILSKISLGKSHFSQVKLKAVKAEKKTRRDIKKAKKTTMLREEAKAQDQDHADQREDQLEFEEQRGDMENEKQLDQNEEQNYEIVENEKQLDQNEEEDYEIVEIDKTSTPKVLPDLSIETTYDDSSPELASTTKKTKMLMDKYKLIKKKSMKIAREPTPLPSPPLSPELPLKFRLRRS